MQSRLGARKIPLLSALTTIGLWTAPAPAQSVDQATVLREARRAEMEYESSVRRYAPLSSSSPRSGSCDEVVGRFCIFYESGGDRLPTEPERIRAARTKAISSIARAYELSPTPPPATAFPLIRFLVRAGRAEEAVVVARHFSSASRDSATAAMVLGFALHAAAETTASLEQFGRWLNALSPAQRKHTTDVRWLLGPRERSRYDKLSPSQRTDYEERLWRYADPLFITPGNEAWADHIARHALARMLASRRAIANVDSWGEDLEQLTVRFGAPLITTRSWRSSGMGSQEQFSEHWDPALRTYVPPVLADALTLEPRLDTIWPIDSLTARSGHNPATIRVMRVLEHQAALFSNRMLVRGVAKADTLTSASVAGAVFLLDSGFNVVGQAEGAASLQGDSVMLTAEVTLHPRAEYYSAELYDPVSRFAARARYRIVRPTAGTTIALSSILLADPFQPGALPGGRDSELLRPVNRPLFSAGSRLGIYAEVATAGEARTVRVQLETSRVDRPGAIGRALGWIGAKVGLSTPRAPTRLGWEIELEPGRPVALPVTLDLGTADAGRYRLTLRVSDGEDTATTTRDFLVVKDQYSRRR